MNILFNDQFIVVLKQMSNNNSVDYSSWIQAIMSIISVLLGVFTIYIGQKFILAKRQNAKFGFYINFLIYIKRIRSLLDDHEGITAYLVSESIRDEKLKKAMASDKASKFKPIFTSLCDEFLEFISKSDNNVVPEHSVSSNISKEEEWKNWYKSILTIVDYVQKCKFIDQSIVLYFTSDQLEKYYSDYNEFYQALEYMENELQRAIEYPKQPNNIFIQFIKKLKIH